MVAARILTTGLATETGRSRQEEESLLYTTCDDLPNFLLNNS